MLKFRQLLLLILDGFGVASPHPGNCIAAANPKNLNYLINHYPTTTLQAAGPSVGLPWGEIGNSEVGHLNLGSGRIVSEDLTRISRAISKGEFFQNPSFIEALKHTKKNNSKLHLVGLVSNGGVHSSEEHLHALLTLAAEYKASNVLVHMFTDGRDTPPKVALASLDRLSRKFLELQIGKIATVIGRFYAMDRAKHWEVTESTYKAMVLGEGNKSASARVAIDEYYQRQIFDETIPPTVITEEGKPVGLIEEGDAVIFFNFRPDRMVQLATAFTDPNFDKFSRKYPYLQNMYYVTMTLYGKNLAATVAFAPIEIRNSLGEVISQNNLSQFHIAESEKYAHITSFFNCGRETPWPGEEREIISSPVAYQKRYEDVPEMSVDKLGQRIIEKLKGGTNFILANFANPDMVGHTGNKTACIRAIEAIDKNIGLIFQAVIQEEACFVISSDHGNIEQVIDLRTGAINKKHTLNPTPLIVAGIGLERKKPLKNGYLELPAVVPEGVLSDVAPTILELLGIPKPEEMSAISLLPFLLEQTR